MFVYSINGHWRMEFLQYFGGVFAPLSFAILVFGTVGRWWQTVGCAPDELPKGPSGKFQRRRLIELFT